MSLINAQQAHTLADQANEGLFRNWVTDLHNSLKREANRGQYDTVVTVPVKYRSKVLNVITYFVTFGYKVSVQGSQVTISW